MATSVSKFVMHVHSIVKLIKPFLYWRFRCRRRRFYANSLPDALLQNLPARASQPVCVPNFTVIPWKHGKLQKNALKLSSMLKLYTVIRFLLTYDVLDTVVISSCVSDRVTCIFCFIFAWEMASHPCFTILWGSCGGQMVCQCLTPLDDIIPLLKNLFIYKL